MQGCGHPDLKDIPLRNQSVNEEVGIVVPDISDCRSYFASYVIVATLFDRLGTDRMRNLLAMIRSGVSYEDAVETLYPGGCCALDEDVRSFVCAGYRN